MHAIQSQDPYNLFMVVWSVKIVYISLIWDLKCIKLKLKWNEIDEMILEIDEKKIGETKLMKKDWSNEIDETKLIKWNWSNEIDKIKFEIHFQYFLISARKLLQKTTSQIRWLRKISPRVAILHIRIVWRTKGNIRILWWQNQKCYGNHSAHWKP